jgi:hypothetical protein
MHLVEDDALLRRQTSSCRQHLSLEIVDRAGAKLRLLGGTEVRRLPTATPSVTPRTTSSGEDDERHPDPYTDAKDRQDHDARQPGDFPQLGQHGLIPLKAVPRKSTRARKRRSGQAAETTQRRNLDWLRSQNPIDVDRIETRFSFASTTACTIFVHTSNTRL